MIEENVLVEEDAKFTAEQAMVAIVFPLILIACVCVDLFAVLKITKNEFICGKRKQQDAPVNNVKPEDGEIEVED